MFVTSQAVTNNNSDERLMTSICLQLVSFAMIPASASVPRGVDLVLERLGVLTSPRNQLIMALPLMSSETQYVFVLSKE